MGRVTVQLNSAGMRELLHDPGVRAELTRHAEAVLARAKANAPVDTGAYRDSLHIIEATTDRVAVRVGSDDWKAMLVEAKTGNLARALDSAGGS